MALVAWTPAALARTFPAASTKRAKSFGNLQLPCSIRAWIEKVVPAGQQGSSLLRLERRAITGDGTHTSVEQQQPQTETQLCKEIQRGTKETSTFMKLHFFPIRDEEKWKFEDVLEHPLPLKSHDEWRQMAQFGPPSQHCFYNDGKENCIYFYFYFTGGQKQEWHDS